MDAHCQLYQEHQACEQYIDGKVQTLWEAEAGGEKTLQVYLSAFEKDAKQGNEASQIALRRFVAERKGKL